MAGYEKRGEEEDIADFVRKKFDRIREDSPKGKKVKSGDYFGKASNLREKWPKKREAKPREDFERFSIPVTEPASREPEITSSIAVTESYSEEQEKHPSIAVMEPSSEKQDSNPLMPISEPIFEETESKQPPSPIGEPVIRQKSSRLPRVILTISIIVFLLAAIIVGFVLFQMYGESTEETRVLGTNENLQSAVISGEQTAYVILSGNLDSNAIYSISIIFSASDDSIYSYNPNFISGEYEINASEVGLESFKDVVVARAFPEYKASPAQANETDDSGSSASLGPFVGFWKKVKGLFD